MMFYKIFNSILLKIKVTIFSSDTREEPFFVVSNMDDCLDLLYRYRMRIEEGFRDIKTLFGFKEIVLKNCKQVRVEILLFLVIVSMGLLMVLYEKSGGRLSEYYKYGGENLYSIIRVIKGEVMDSWANPR